MATLDLSSILDPSQYSNPAGFQMGRNQLDRSMLLSQTGLDLTRAESDYGQNVGDLASSQAARGAFFSGATHRKGQRLLDLYNRQTGDIELGRSYQLGKLGLSDIGASIPGVSF